MICHTLLISGTHYERECISSIIYFLSLHSTSSHVAKRFINSRACREIFSSINPQMYFQSNDIFFPKFVRTVKCEGTPNNPVHCGSAQGSMRCLTRMSDVKVMRIPSSGQCSWRRPVMIRNVPVGCYCEY